MTDWPEASLNAKGCFDVAIEAMRERLEKFRCERIGPHRLFLGDCAEILPLLGTFDAVVTDPPYGIREAAGANASRSKPFGGAALKMPGKTIIARDYGDDTWDNAPASSEIIASLLAKSKWQIIFGGNFFSLPPTSCVLVWDKLNTGDFADCELAWTNLPKAVRRLRYMWNGMLRANNEQRGDHPTQKPVGVMKWCLQQLPPTAKTVLDPYAGSGTTGIACVQMGMFFTGIERETKYFDAMVRRISDAIKQPDLFIDQPKEKPVQEKLTFEVSQ